MGVKERKHRDKLRRSNEIIDAAEEVIFSKGIQNATMEEIAKTAELGKATLYVYYKSKDEILLAIQERAVNKLASLFEKAASDHQKGFDKTRAIGDAYYNFAKEYPNYYQFISLFEMEDTKIDVEKSMENADKTMSILERSIETGIKDGSIRNDINSQITARCLWAMSTGVMQMLHRKGKVFEKNYKLSSDDFMEHFMRILDSALKP